jgi:mono/diheme cytochrome c family protein
VSFRTSLIILNLVAFGVIAGYIVYRVVSVRRNPERQQPQNLTPFLRDDELEGRRLERALGWSLLFVLVLAIALPVYFIVEPTRESAAKDAFHTASVQRGAVLFANKQAPAYDSTKSLLCADCHGVDASGGFAPFTLQPEADICLKVQNQGKADIPACLPKQVSWKAPALNSELLRFDRGQVKQIITYGRPGTPMPAWGVASGKGVLQPQGIDDLVNYIDSIQISSAKAKAESTAAVAQFRVDADKGVKTQEDALAADTKAVADAQAQLVKDQASNANPDKITADQDALKAAQLTLSKDPAVLASVVSWKAQVDKMSEGEILFRLNCARCHTKNWSFFDPTKPDQPQPAPSGTGAYGPPLDKVSLQVQFPGKAGRQNQFNWVAIGVPANNLYGIRGISSGRMPHFINMLSTKQIKQIISYERHLDASTAEAP